MELYRTRRQPPWRKISSSCHLKAHHRCVVLVPTEPEQSAMETQTSPFYARPRTLRGPKLRNGVNGSACPPKTSGRCPAQLTVFDSLCGLLHGSTLRP